ncbi:MAG TPA: hypothetical protein H9950_09415 [Candidatus Bacteroides avicola]|uniref:Uncharacterized protein n=1 Tax=Candidatus Bacteroides avicola TaxID=2838468 RepID=A0A9D2KVG8_9BACE|nr:hypothetical protein [Candidatus Bacteroides avicola]
MHRRILKKKNNETYRHCGCCAGKIRDDAARCHARCQPFLPYTDEACCLYVCSKVPVPLKQDANTAEGEHLPIQTRQAPDRPTVDVPAQEHKKTTSPQAYA